MHFVLKKQTLTNLKKQEVAQGHWTVLITILYLVPLADIVPPDELLGSLVSVYFLGAHVEVDNSAEPVCEPVVSVDVFLAHLYFLLLLIAYPNTYCF